MKRFGLMILALAVVGQADTALAQLRITDTTQYDTATQMLLANEINESGEPYAEAIGYDLDQLDPQQPGFPDAAAYALGIENYEYSRYQLGEVIARSGIGLHMMWSPMIIAAAAMETDPGFDGSHTGGMVNGHLEDDALMKAVMHFGHLANQMPPQNAWPQFGEFVGGDPHYGQPVDADAFAMDFATVRWNRDLMTKQLSPGAMGQSLMKQYLWAQDMLGGFHDANDEGIVPDGIISPDGPDGRFDAASGVFYGGNSLDGFVGQVLTAEGISKVKNLVDNLAYDGSRLGSVDPMTYDPAFGLRYFPHRILVTEEPVAGLPARVAGYEVVDPRSDLFDQVSLLWGTVHFKNMMDPANSSDEAHLAYHAVFDGDPFPADMATTGMAGPFDLMKGASRVIFLNLMAMHFDEAAGTFVDTSVPARQAGAWADEDDDDDRDADKSGGRHGDGIRRGRAVSTVNAAYALVALAAFQEEFAGTPLADTARRAMASQADFLLANLPDRRDLYSEGTHVRGRGRGHAGSKTVLAQAAAVRGLYAAYETLGDSKYLTAADDAYAALVAHYYEADSSAFATRSGSRRAVYTPEVVAVVAGALREARLVGGHEEATSIYVEFWGSVANKMQLAEGAETGESGGDSDHDGIPFIPEQPDGLAPVFAPQAELLLAGNRHGHGGHDKAESALVAGAVTLHRNEPNPFNPATVISFSLPRAGRVSLAVHDLRGRLVSRLVDSDLAAGDHEVTFRGDDLASGIYTYALDVDGSRQVGRMTLLK
jgi:hypothetical protein